jgi:hypothetical protein
MLCHSREALNEWNLLSDSRILETQSTGKYINIKYKRVAMHRCLAYFQFHALPGITLLTQVQNPNHGNVLVLQEKFNY